MSQGHYQGRDRAGSNDRMKGGFVRKAYKSKGDDATLSRWVKVPAAERKFTGKPRQQWLFDERHPSIAAGRSYFYRKGVTQPSKHKNLLVSGHSNAKIGRDVRKGLFRGYWIYTLSLEERNTCPRSCHHWRSCYGNNMPYAKRIDHTADDFLPRLEAELERLCAPWPGRGGKPKRKGVLVRLHALGDFYSEEYVQFWGKMLRRYSNLAVYGYTARSPYSGIGLEIDILKDDFDKRFSVRWSDGPFEAECTVSIHKAEEKPENAFLCPEQTPGFTSKGKPILCATCGLCWSTDKNVAFQEH